MGRLTTASGTAMGGSTSTWSTAMGRDTNAQDYISFVVGSHNKTKHNLLGFFQLLFVIGNRSFDSNGYDGQLL